MGISGTGLVCHVCTGEENECQSAADAGTSTDCGDDVRSCLLGKSNDGTSVARGCGIKGNPATLGKFSK